MGLEKLNPFKKSQKSADSLKPDDSLAPAKSSSSIAHSIRSFGDKAEEFMSKGEKPRELYQTGNKEYDANTLPVTLTTAGAGVGGTSLGPAVSSGLR